MKPSEKPIDQVDQLFKNKLEDHTIAPPDNAWTRVEAGLAKKNPADQPGRTIVLWRWAAAILLTGALITIIYQPQKNSESQTFAEKKIVPQKVTPETVKPSSTKEEKQSNSVTHKDLAKKPAIKRNPHSNEQTPASPEEVLPVKNQLKEIKQRETVTENSSAQISDTNSIQEKVTTEATTSKAIASTTQKPIKLEFTLEDLPLKETVATTSEEKNSGLKKVLNLARDIKQGEGFVGNLREKKNELFANTFMNKKTKSQ